MTFEDSEQALKDAGAVDVFTEFGAVVGVVPGTDPVRVVVLESDDDGAGWVTGSVADGTGWEQLTTPCRVESFDALAAAVRAVFAVAVAR
jgi:hypothetical protein